MHSKRIVLRSLLVSSVVSLAPAKVVRDPAQVEYWKSVQQALNDAGYDAGPVDGAPGRRTQAAVRTFQADMGAAPDGTLDAGQYRELVRLAEARSIPGAPSMLEVRTPVSPLPADAPLSTVATTTADDMPATGVDDAELDFLSTEMDVLGVGIGSPADGAAVVLSTEVGECRATGDFTVCSGSKEAFEDQVAFAAHGSGADKAVYFISRTLSFARPVPEAAVLERLADSMPSLIDDPDRLIASSAVCGDAVSGEGYGALVEGIRLAAEAGGVDDVVSRDLDCRAFYTARLIGDGSSVVSVEVALYDGRLLEEGTATAGVPVVEALPDEVKF
jgi:hypothetical protein